MSSEYEATVIAGLLANPRWLSQAMQLSPDDFESAGYKAVFAGVRGYYKSNIKEGRKRYATGKVVRRYLQERLKGRKAKKARESAMSALQFVADWPVPTKDDWLAALDGLLNDSIERSVAIEMQDTIDEFMEDGVVGLKQRIRKMHSIVDRGRGDRNRVRSMREASSEILTRYNQDKDEGLQDVIATGFPGIDRVATARPGRLWVWSAYTADGKSVMGREFAYMASIVQGFNSLVITMEMTRQDVEVALAVRHAHMYREGGIDWREAAEGRLDAKQEAVYRMALNDLATNDSYGRIHVWQPPRRSTLGDVVAKMEELSEEAPLHCVVLDYMTLFEPTFVNRNDNRQDRLMALFEEAAGIATDFETENGRGIWLIALHQISRKGWEEAQKRGYYVMPDLGETRGAERNAALVGWNLRDEQMKEVHEVRLGIMKNRFGPDETLGFDCHENFAAGRIEPMEESGWKK